MAAVYFYSKPDTVIESPPGTTCGHYGNCLKSYITFAHSSFMVSEKYASFCTSAS